MEHEKDAHRAPYKLRDAAKLVLAIASLVSPIVMVLGLLGVRAVANYRLEELEREHRELRRSFGIHVTDAATSAIEFKLYAKRVDRCCPYYRGGIR